MLSYRSHPRPSRLPGKVLVVPRRVSQQFCHAFTVSPRHLCSPARRTPRTCECRKPTRPARARASAVRKHPGRAPAYWIFSPSTSLQISAAYTPVCTSTAEKPLAPRSTGDTVPLIRASFKFRSLMVTLEAQCGTSRRLWGSHSAGTICRRRSLRCALMLGLTGRPSHLNALGLRLRFILLTKQNTHVSAALPQFFHNF